RRLRDLKNELGVSHEDLARRAAIPLDRVKTYFSLFSISDFLLRFFESHDVPLKIAAEFARYERATSESKAKQLVSRYHEEKLTAQEIAGLRKRIEGKKAKNETKGKSQRSAGRIFERLTHLLKSDRDSSIERLDSTVAPFGYRVVLMNRSDEEGAS